MRFISLYLCRPSSIRKEFQGTLDWKTNREQDYNIICQVILLIRSCHLIYKLHFSIIISFVLNISMKISSLKNVISQKMIVKDDMENLAEIYKIIDLKRMSKSIFIRNDKQCMINRLLNSYQHKQCQKPLNYR
ncbi:unnamed protein product [Paramecium octaurelia]|uniref:Uncharacterized protein n=1 Tax=Paramecium octaurelia TaxID=43137 RepID=A0A8S1SX33_PAROT|nr:unnamed protein product [Paramecium octaurelia]